MSLLERDDQLLRLEAALEDARQGAGATVLVSGEAGIAGRLYRSRRSVDNHVAALLARLGVGSRHDALVVAASLGLLAPPDREI